MSNEAKTLSMAGLSATTPASSFTTWMSRAFLMPPAAILALIGLRCITNPLHALATTGVTYSSPEPVTDTRVIGALALTLAVLVVSAVLSRTRLRQGHLIVVLVMALALTIRLTGFAIDGTSIGMGDQRAKTIGEALFLTLNSVGLAVQSRRR